MALPAWELRRRIAWLAGAVFLALAALLVAVSVAVAAPANDDFVNAQEIGPTLPVSLTESNEGATKEEGEPAHAELGSKGHSVWFKWEAQSTGFVTVGTCGSAFRTVVSVYTGTEVDALTKVAGDHASEGPGCPSYDGREVTFKTHAGTTYEIAVDGEAYYVPPSEPPVGEGTFALQVRATPVPCNDDFADASPLAVKSEKNPGGAASIPLALTATTGGRPLRLASQHMGPGRERRSGTGGRFQRMGRIGSTALAATAVSTGTSTPRRPAIFVFHFASTEPGSTFRCKVDGRRWTRCGSRMTFARPGRHVLEVAAVDPSGNVDPTPAVARFRIAPIRR